MSTLDQIRDGFHHAWDSLAEGWNSLRQRASHALTQFSPGKTQAEFEPSSERLLENASRWALLAAEVKEDDKQVQVRLEAPGMEPDDFEIQVINNVLVVSGDKQVEREQTSGRYYLLERAYGSFERAIQLPAEVEEDDAKASYRRGVLAISLPKKQQRSVRRIEIS